MGKMVGNIFRDRGKLKMSTNLFAQDSFMQVALTEAQDAYNQDEVPVGAVVVLEGKIISKAHNMCNALNDATAHAEMLALKKACSLIGTSKLYQCHLYVTLEPCPMCAHAISMMRIEKIYWGCDDLKGGGALNGARLYNHSVCFHKPEVINGIMEQECRNILQKFFHAKRLSI